MPGHPDPVAVALVSGSLDDLNWFQNKFEIREWKVICTGIGFGFILKVEYGAWGGYPPKWW